MSPATFEHIHALLIDLDGVLYVEEEPIPGAVEALQRFRGGGLKLRFVTNTTAHSRDRTLEKLARLRLPVETMSSSPRRRSPSTRCSLRSRSTPAPQP